MIVVDTSALVAIAFGEPERDDFVQVIQRAGRALICTVLALEARMVVQGWRGQRAIRMSEYQYGEVVVVEKLLSSAND